MPRYLNPNIKGLITADAANDGYTISLKWATAYSDSSANSIAYHIYMSSDLAPDFTSDFFNQLPSFISYDGSNSVDIIDLTPGQMYHFAVRAVEYGNFDFATLQQGPNGLAIYPKSLLQSNISSIDTVIPLIDTEGFPNFGTVKIGVELISYNANNTSLNELTVLQRGVADTKISFHNTDGYDGYHIQDPFVSFWPIRSEEQNTKVFQAWARFDVNHFPFTITDGYRQKIKNILTSNLAPSDAANVGFPSYDYSGYHRTDPVMLLRGDCVGSYIGGSQGCADSSDGIGRQLRGLSVQDQNLQRQEVLLSLTGEPVVLLKRRYTGMTCTCFLPHQEYPDARCNKCFGGGIVVSYDPYHNPRRADQRIMVRFDPSVEELKATDSGLESEFSPNAWTLSVPGIHDRDIIIRFDQDGNEDFRYEIINVTRNKLLLDEVGAQKFVVQRIRKTDIIYQIPYIKDVSPTPRVVYTSFADSLGIPSHQHQIIIPTQYASISQINTITSIVQGHSHSILNGEVATEELHTHTILF